VSVTVRGEHRSESQSSFFTPLGSSCGHPLNSRAGSRKCALSARAKQDASRRLGLCHGLRILRPAHRLEFCALNSGRATLRIVETLTPRASNLEPADY
jgi:hypothetical protein